MREEDWVVCLFCPPDVCGHIGPDHQEVHGEGREIHHKHNSVSKVEKSIHVDREEAASRAARAENAYGVLEAALRAVYEILHPPTTLPVNLPTAEDLAIGDEKRSGRDRRRTGTRGDST